MAVYELTLPLDDATVEKLQVGDIIYLVRPAAHV